MNATLKLLINWHTRRAHRNLLSEAKFTLPNLSLGDVLPLQIEIIEPDVIGGRGFTKVDIAGLGLVARINDPSDASMLTQQSSWTTDTINKRFIGTLPLNTGDLSTFLGAEASATVTFVVRLVEAGGGTTTIYEESATLIANQFSTVSEDPAPGFTTLSKELADQLYVPYILPAGRSITIPATGDTNRTVIYTDTTGFHADFS